MYSLFVSGSIVSHDKKKQRSSRLPLLLTWACFSGVPIGVAKVFLNPITMLIPPQTGTFDGSLHPSHGLRISIHILDAQSVKIHELDGGFEDLQR